VGTRDKNILDKFRDVGHLKEDFVQY